MEITVTLADLLTIATLLGGTVGVIVQLRIAAKRGEAKLHELGKWMKQSDRRHTRNEALIMRLLENAKLSESAIINPILDDHP